MKLIENIIELIVLTEIVKFKSLTDNAIKLMENKDVEPFCSSFFTFFSIFNFNFKRTFSRAPPGGGGAP